jgi:hypothetical protein
VVTPPLPISPPPPPHKQSLHRRQLLLSNSCAVADPFETDITAIRAAWLLAAQDLSIRVTVDDPLLVDDTGTRYPVVAIVHDFGGRRGMAVLLAYEAPLAEIAQSQGYGYTVLAPSYETYDRDLFVDTLNDWQWRGVGEPPPWYTGEPWNS